MADWMDRPDDIAHLYLELLDRLNIGQLNVIGTLFGGWIVAAAAATPAPPDAGRPQVVSLLVARNRMTPTGAEAARHAM